MTWEGEGYAGIRILGLSKMRIPTLAFGFGDLLLSEAYKHYAGLGGGGARGNPHFGPSGP